MQDLVLAQYVQTLIVKMISQNLLFNRLDQFANWQPEFLRLSHVVSH